MEISEVDLLLGHHLGVECLYQPREILLHEEPVQRVWSPSEGLKLFPVEIVCCYRLRLIDMLALEVFIRPLEFSNGQLS